MEVAKVLSSIASLFYEMKKFKESVETYDECLEIKKKLLGEEHADYKTTMRNRNKVEEKLKKKESKIKK